MSLQTGAQLDDALEGPKPGQLSATRDAHAQVLAYEQACAPGSIALAVGLTAIVQSHSIGDRYRLRVAKRALSLMEANVGIDDGRLIPSLKVIAFLSKGAELEANLRRMLALLDKHKRHDVEHIACTLEHLGGICSEQQRFAEAEPFYRRACAIVDGERARGIEHRLLDLCTQHYLWTQHADCLFQLGQYTEAGAIYARLETN